MTCNVQGVDDAHATCYIGNPFPLRPLLLLDLVVEGNLEIFQRSLHSTAAKIAPVLFIKLDEDGH